MTQLLPQEIDVWYLIPALRKEVAQVLSSKHHMKQKEIARLLHVTEAAISQYKSSKRANELSFSAEEKEIIEKHAKRIANRPEKATEYFFSLTRKLQGCNAICNYHFKIDKTVEKGCTLCRK